MFERAVAGSGHESVLRLVLMCWEHLLSCRPFALTLYMKWLVLVPARSCSSSYTCYSVMRSRRIVFILFIYRFVMIVFDRSLYLKQKLQ